MNNTLRIILAALAVYRLSLMVSREDGPAWIFRKLRRLPPPRSSARDGLSCQLCVSIYMSAAVSAFVFFYDRCPEWAQRTGDFVLLWLALSAAAICIHMTFTKGI